MLFQNTAAQKKKAHFIYWEHRIFLVTLCRYEGMLVTWQNLKLVDSVYLSPAEWNTVVFCKILLKLFSDLECCLPCTLADDLGMASACLQPVQSKMWLSFPSFREVKLYIWEMPNHQSEEST